MLKLEYPSHVYEDYYAVKEVEYIPFPNPCTINVIRHIFFLYRVKAMVCCFHVCIHWSIFELGINFFTQLEDLTGIKFLCDCIARITPLSRLTAFVTRQREIHI